MQAAKLQLEDLKLKFTDQHPEVVQKKAEIALLEKQQSVPGMKPPAPAAGADPLFMRSVELRASKPKLKKEIEELGNQITNLVQRLQARSDRDLSYALKKAELDSKTKARDELARAERESLLYADASLGYFDVYQPATPESINKKGRWMKISVLALLAGLVGFGVTAGIALFTEALDTTLRTPEDIMRITKLPVFATLGDLRKMTAKEQVDWAFRTLTLLQGKLSRNSEQALVCGITSANHGEGRSTWVNLLVGAASQRGLRVLTVDTRPAAAPTSAPLKEKPEPVAVKKATVNGTGDETRETSEDHRVIPLPDEPTMTLSKDVLSAPEEVIQQFEDPKAQPVVHIPMPGWVWSVERRKQWQRP